MQTYDVFMLLVLIAAGVWGYWKGFIWQLASLASIFFSYFLAFGLRVQVAKLIDAPPPWNMFAAMGIVYVLSSAIIWIGTGFSSDLLASLKLKDFDRQIGATFGVAKGVIFCLLITFFAVTLLGEREKQRICGSTSGRFIAKMLKSSGGLIPKELAAVVDPYLTPFEETLEQYQAPQVVDNQPAPQNAPWPEQGSVAWNQPYATQQPAPQYQQYGYPPPQQTYQQPTYQQPQYDPRYDPRYAPQYAPPQYPNYQPGPPAYDPRYDPAPQYAPPSYNDPRYSAPQDNNYDPRYDDPRRYQTTAEPRQDYAAPPAYAPQQGYPYDPQTYQR